MSDAAPILGKNSFYFSRYLCSHEQNLLPVLSHKFTDTQRIKIVLKSSNSLFILLIYTSKYLQIFVLIQRIVQFFNLFCFDFLAPNLKNNRSRADYLLRLEQSYVAYIDENEVDDYRRLSKRFGCSYSAIQRCVKTLFLITIYNYRIT
jgi:hypothetical protein